MFTIDTDAWLVAVQLHGLPGLRVHCHEWLDADDILSVAKALAGLCAARGDMFTAPERRLSAIAGIRHSGRVQDAVKALEIEQWIRVYRPDQRRERGHPSVYTLVLPAR